VRQGAMIAMAMVLIQESETGEKDKLKAFREKMLETVPDKHQPTMAKMGAILATGILNAGGRNVTIALASNAGFKRMTAVVGMAMFLQYWYWYPLAHFLSFTFTPTALIGVNKDMKMPKNFKMKCNARPSLFAYPEMLKEEVEKEKKRIATVTLSTTAKAAARKKKKDREAGVEEGANGGAAAMDVDADAGEAKESTSGGTDEESGATKMDVDGDDAGAAASKDEAEKKKEKADEPEPEFFDISNPQRVTRRQRAFVTVPGGQRYSTVLKSASRTLGIVMLRDSTPGEEEEFVEVKPLSIGAATDDDEGEEPSPPADFFWIPPASA